ncbi:MAG: zinc-dependent metalloprotease [Actinomycetes bacterium]|jgi:putative hydrolase
MSDLPFGFGMPGPESGKPFDMNQLGAALQQIGAMLQSGSQFGAQGGSADQGPVNWSMVNDVARKALVASGDPVVAEAEQRAVVDAMRLADVWLDSVVTFPATTAPAVAWSRSEWLEATLPAWKVIVAPIAEQMQQAVSKQGGGAFDLESLQANLPEQLRSMLPDGIPPEMAQMLQPMMAMAQQLSVVAFSGQLGQALAALASDVVSASEIGIPLTEMAVCALVPANVTQFGSGLGVPVDDVRLYLALRESAHQRLFAHVPWLRPRVIGAVEAYAKGMTVDSERLQSAMGDVDFNDPEALQQLMSAGLMKPEDTAEQRAALARLETLLALVEGWVDDVVDSAIAERMTSAVQLRETMRRRRAAGGPAERTFATLVGMELRPRLLREAATLFAVVRAGRGVEERDALWAHPDLLPSPDDLADPLGFIEVSAQEFELPPSDDDATE